MSGDGTDEIRSAPDFKDFVKIYKSRARLVTKETFVFVGFSFPKDGPHNIDCDIPPPGSVILHSDGGETGVRCCELLSGLKCDDEDATEKALLQNISKKDNIEDILKKLRLTGTALSDVTMETVTHKNLLLSDENSELIKNVFLTVHIFKPLMVDPKFVVHGGGISSQKKCKCSPYSCSTVNCKSLSLGGPEVMHGEAELLFGLDKELRPSGNPVTFVTIKHDDTRLRKIEPEPQSDSEAEVDSDDESNFTDITRFEELPTHVGAIHPDQIKAVLSDNQKLHGLLPHAAQIAATKFLVFTKHEENSNGSKVHFCILCGTNGLYLLIYHSEYDVMLMTLKLAPWVECQSLALIWFVLNRKYFGLVDAIDTKLKSLEEQNKVTDLKCGFKDYVNSNDFLKKQYGSLKKYPVQPESRSAIRSRKRPIPVYLEDM